MLFRSINGEVQNTVEYWHQLYGKNMTQFFDILSADNLMEDIFSLFSNKYLDELLKPEWERFGVKLERAEVNGKAHGNGIAPSESDEKENINSSCCVLS